MGRPSPVNLRSLEVTVAATLNEWTKQVSNIWGPWEASHGISWLCLRHFQLPWEILSGHTAVLRSPPP